MTFYPCSSEAFTLELGQHLLCWKYREKWSRVFRWTVSSLLTFPTFIHASFEIACLIKTESVCSVKVGKYVQAGETKKTAMTKKMIVNQECGEKGKWTKILGEEMEELLERVFPELLAVSCFHFLCCVSVLLSLLFLPPYSSRLAAKLRKSPTSTKMSLFAHSSTLFHQPAAF